MPAPAPTLLPILRSSEQGRLLAELAAAPAREWSVRELADHLAVSPMTVSREVSRAAEASIVQTRRQGRNLLVKFNADHPLARPLREVLLATFGAPAVIAEEFADLAGVEFVAIIGSWAARYRGDPGEPPGDVDVLVVGSDVDRESVEEAAIRSERRLGTDVQAAVRTRAAWQEGSEPFLATVQSRPYVVILGDAATESNGGAW